MNYIITPFTKKDSGFAAGERQVDIAAAAVFRDAVSRRAHATVLWVALLGWALGILWLSSLTPQQLPDTAFALSDKASHLLAYTVGGWLAATSLRLTRPQSATVGWFAPAVLLVAAFGVLDEYVQTFTPGRTGGDLDDWIADLLGAVLGASLSLLTHRHLRQRQRR